MPQLASSIVYSIQWMKEGCGSSFFFKENIPEFPTKISIIIKYITVFFVIN